MTPVCRGPRSTTPNRRDVLLLPAPGERDAVYRALLESNGRADDRYAAARKA